MFGDSFPMSLLMAVVGIVPGVLLFLGKSGGNACFLSLTAYALLLAFVGFGALSNIAVIHKVITVALAVIALAACRLFFLKRLVLPAKVTVCACVLVLYLDIFVF